MSLLFIAHRAPFAPDRGDRIRSYHVLRHLSARMPVHLVTFADAPEPVPQLGLASCTVVPRQKGQIRAAAEALATGRPVSVAAFAARSFTRAVAAVTDMHAPAAAYVFSGQMAQYVPSSLPFVMDFVDLDSAKFAGLARGPLRALYRREARLLARWERAAAARAAASLFVSRAEAALFDGPGRVEVVENGIDTAHFRPRAVPPTGGAAIVFTGQMDYAPNVEAVRWFVERVLPLIRRAHPDAALAIVGRAPVAAVRALAKVPGVTVTGEVADVRGHLAAARVAVAPLQLARGIQNKVLEAMASGLPVVATSGAAEGIDHAGTLRIADDPDRFAAEVAALLRAPGDLGARARARVEARYGWQAALAPLDILIAQASSPPAAQIRPSPDMAAALVSASGRRDVGVGA